MQHHSRTKERVYRYLSEMGPSSSIEIERALDISQSMVSMLLRAEPDLRKVDRSSALLYSWEQTKLRPPTIAYTIADNLRIAAALYDELRATNPSDTAAVREIAERFIAKSVRITAHLEKLLEAESNNDDDS